VTLSALSLILLASFIHAAWNLLAKRSASGVTFVWLYSLANFLLYAPLVLYIVVTDRPQFGALGWTLILSSGVLHLLYAITLQRGYNVADISVIYPVARGTGPLISSVGAIIVFNEIPSIFGSIGIALIIGGILLIAGGTSILHSRDPRTVRGILYGVLTGLCISAYTIVDAYAVKSLLISPIVYQYLENSTRVVALAPFVLKNATFASELRRTWRLALGVGFLVPISYILVLYAMRLAPVSYVAPARELSMLIGALIGAKLFREGHVIERAIGCVMMLIGIAGLTAA
jgi:drug/metabolite transporter (DMT)-like permease